MKKEFFFVPSVDVLKICLLMSVVLLSACDVLRPAAPIIASFDKNAYPLANTENLTVELDNPLFAFVVNSEDEKQFKYYAFRVVVKSPRAGDFYFSSGKTGNQLTLYKNFKQVDAPCDTENSDANLDYMKAVALDQVGLGDSAAVYSDEIESMIQNPDIAGVVWPTCNPNPTLPAQDEKSYYQKSYSLLLREDEVPNKLSVRVKYDTWFILSHAATAAMQISEKHMAVVGDSVMWGQGLNEIDKVGKRMQMFLAQQMQAAVDFQSTAHSGARLGASNACANADLYGEVPSGSPSINCQLRNLVEPERIDVMLLNGCVNNVSGFSIVSGVNFSTLFNMLGDNDAEQSLVFTIADINSRTTEFCREGMKTLITDARRIAPNADIIVNGYFPLLSLGSIASCPAQTFNFLASFTGAGIAGSAATLFMLPLLVLYPPSIMITVPFIASASASGGAVTLGVTEAGLALYLNKAQERSRAWISLSDIALEAAIRDIREDETLDDIASLGQGNMAFSRVSDLFMGREAYTLDPLLFSTRCDLNTDDPINIRTLRISACEARYDTSEGDIATLFKFNTCIRAAAFHPNESGNAVYFNRAMQTLNQM